MVEAAALFAACEKTAEAMELMVYAERVLPNSIEAEEGVIGSLLLDGEALGKLRDLEAADFFNEGCRRTYEACRAVHERGSPVDQLTVADELAHRGQLADVGGHGYLSSLIAALPTSLHAEGYADIVRRLAVLRGFVEAGSEVAAMGYAAGEVEESLARGEALLAKLRDRSVTGEAVTLRSLLDKFLEEMNAAPLPDAPLVDGKSPVPMGLADLDQLLGGMQRSDLVIVAARPSVGKSALAVSVARNAAAQGARVGVVSLEMSNEQVALRLLAAETGVDTQRLRLHLCSADEERRITQAVGRLSDLVMYMEDRSTQTVKGIASWARRIHDRRGLDLLVVDYLQLIQGTSGRAQDRVQEVTQISRELKALARNLHIPLLVCSQLNRQVESRASHRPMLSDLRDSGSIEQDADVVMFIHREELYTPEEQWDALGKVDMRGNPIPYPAGVAEIIVAKHRNGPVGSLWLRFNGRLARFEDLPINVDAEGVVTGR